MTALVRFQDVSKRYRLGQTRTSLPSMLSTGAQRMFLRGHTRQASKDDFWALQGISFELSAGESLALIGRNGAGKTTMLKLLASITKPTSGAIELNGQLSALIELGAGFHPDLTGRENVYLNGAILGISRRDLDARYDEIVEFAELEQFMDTPVKRYSSGMTVRLGFAVASCLEPEILLVDEVLAVGDVSFQQKCMRRIRELVAGGTSIIFVSHNFYLVQAVCEKALYLKGGKVRASGPTREMIDLYEQDLQQERASRLVGEAARKEEGDIEVTHVEVRRWSDGSQEHPFASTEPVEIRVHYIAHRSIGASNVSVFITRSDGVTTCMMRTKLDEFEVDVQQGRGVVSVLVDPVQLVSGTYYVEAWFLNESDSIGITTRPGRSNLFSVKGVALAGTDNSGYFEPRTQWAHERLSAQDSSNSASPYPQVSAETIR